MHQHSSAILLCLAAVPAAWTPAAAQCSDPPSNGRHVLHADQPVLLSDGYVTLMDVRVPEVAPGACGWPLIVMVHGGGGSKSAIADKAIRQANLGYVVATYDVRGQGPSMSLNNPALYGRADLGLRERMDLFEVMEAAEAGFAASIDFDRIGVAGGSQGAVHCWFAAAHSGRTPPANPWRTSPFPLVTAVAAENFNPDFVSTVLPEAKSMTHMGMFNLFSPTSGIHNEPTFLAQVRPLIEAEDFAAVDALIRPAELDLLPLLAGSSTAVLATMAIGDKHGSPNQLVENWNAISPGQPKLLNLTTGGHGTPQNDHESGIRRVRKEEWFDRWLKGIENGIENEAEVRLALTPFDLQTYRAVDSLWDLREAHSLPLSLPSETRFLREGGALSLAPPTSSQGRDSLVQTVRAGFSILDYIANLPNPATLQGEIPLATIRYETETFSSARLLQGVPEASLFVDSTSAEYLVHVALFDEDTKREEQRFLTSGFTTIRGDRPPGTNELTFELGFVSTIVEAGHRLAVQVENLAWNRPDNGPGASFLHALPIFSDFSYDVVRTAAAPSSITLPMTTERGGPSLVADVTFIRNASVPDFTLTLRASAAERDWNYAILIGISGIAPGHLRNGVHVPLNNDFVTNIVDTNPSSLPIKDFTGRIDGEGIAVGEVELTRFGALPPSVERLHFAALITSPSGQVSKATNAVTLPVRR